MFSNPLLSPDILGVSAGAGLGAVPGIFAGLYQRSQLKGLGFGFGLATERLAFAITATLCGRGDVLIMVLCAVALGGFPTLTINFPPSHAG